MVYKTQGHVLPLCDAICLQHTIEEVSHWKPIMHVCSVLTAQIGDISSMNTENYPYKITWWQCDSIEYLFTLLLFLVTRPVVYVLI